MLIPYKLLNIYARCNNAFNISMGLPLENLIWAVAFSSLLFLAFLGGLAAFSGGASIFKGAWRVTFWGALAMALTAGVRQIFDVE